jgi:hypothetical protein
MKSKRFDPSFRLLFASLNEYIDVLKPDVLDLQTVRDEQLYQRWKTLLKCFAVSKKILDAIEANDRAEILKNISAGKAACRKCIAVCNEIDQFKKSVLTVRNILTLLQKYPHKF